MKFEGLDMLLSKKDIENKLTAAEANYLRKGPELSHHDFETLRPAAHFKIDPTEEKVMKIISNLNKVDSFYKRYRAELAAPLAAILLAIDRSHLFFVRM